MKLNTVFVLDMKNETVTWTWGNRVLEGQHHATVLESGNVLLFDNGKRRGYSRILEIDPNTKNVVWEYGSQPHQRFYSSTRGASQRLPNGNTLISNSNSGLVFEITRAGEEVWSFYTGLVDRKPQRFRELFYRAKRIPISKLPLRTKT